MGKSLSEQTKIKIGLANRGIWVIYNCDYCKKQNEEKQSHYKRNKKHFCNRGCYSNYRKELLSFSEQHAYKGVRKEGESRQIYHQNFCKKYPDTISHLKARRYAREKGATGKHSLDEWNKLKNANNNKCVICKEEKKLTKDHIIPLSKGGTDFIENIQPLCKNCNSKKHNKINPNINIG